MNCARFRVLFIVLITGCVCHHAFAQDHSADWIRKLEDSGSAGSKPNTKNVIAQYSRYDFSQPIRPQSDFLGFIEPNYQRLNVYFERVSKSKTDPRVYVVKGASVVKGNRCDFTGTIKLTEVREYLRDEEYTSQGINRHGIAIGTFRFEEDPKQKHVGVFEGMMILYWYVDQKGRVRYDDMEIGADGYRNNQYVSTWTQYGSKTGKAANWGEYRIPMSGDLDIGDGEFSVNPKYLDNGWRDFKTPR